MTLATPQHRGPCKAGQRLNHRRAVSTAPRAAASSTNAALHPVLQAKLRIGPPNDEFEREADRISKQAMQNPGSPPIRSSENPGLEVSPETANDIRKANGRGAPMAKTVRHFFESRLGQDLGPVRIHNDPMAASIAQSLQAAAFTFGSDIFFNAGRYRPDSRSGLGLLAHELTHTVQQRGGSVSRQLIQRATIPYRPVTWADFLAAPPPNATNSPEGAGILTKFDLIPSYSPVTTASPTKKKCTVGGRSSNEVESTAMPDPADFNKPEAVMDQDQSWALPRYTGNGSAFCAGQITRCESDFDNLPTTAANTCRQAATACQNAFKAGQRSFGQYFNGTPVQANRQADCMTTFFSQCQRQLISGFSVSDRGATARTKADCRGSFFQRCLTNEVVERARLLRHEQGHFDITNVMARNARESIKVLAASLPVKETGCGEDAARDAARISYRSKVGDVLKRLGADWMASKDQAQRDYDGQTGGGSNAGSQSIWERSIAGGLTTYGPATAPLPAGLAPIKSPAIPTQNNPPTVPPKGGERPGP